MGASQLIKQTYSVVKQHLIHKSHSETTSQDSQACPCCLQVSHIQTFDFDSASK